MNETRYWRNDDGDMYKAEFGIVYCKIDMSTVWSMCDFGPAFIEELREFYPCDIDGGRLYGNN